MHPVHTEHHAQVLNWALLHIFSVCIFKEQFVFVRSGAGGRGELGSVWLSVRRGSLRVHQTRRTSRLLGSAFLRLVFECFKIF